MPPTTYLSEKLIDRLKFVKTNGVGSLYGIFYDNSALILGLSFEEYSRNDDGSSKNNFGSSQPHYPAEIDYCGLVSFQSDASIENDQASFVAKAVEDVSITDSPFVAVVNVSTSGPSTISLYCCASKILNPVNYKILSEKEIKNQFLTIRLCSKLPLTCGSKEQSINDRMADLQKKISSDSLMFNFPDQNVFLSDTYLDSNLSGSSTAADIVSVHKTEEGSTSSKKKGKAAPPSNTGLLTAKMYLRSTKSEEDNENHPSNPPTVCQTKHESDCLEIWLDIDALSMVHTKKKLQHLSNILVDSISRSLTLIEQALLRNSSSAPVTHHYSLNQLSHFFTLVYPEKVLEDTLKNYRESLHKLLGLPTNQPFFRRGNAHQFEKKEKSFNSLLVNPHEGLPSSGVKSGEVALIHGKYTYHHYMQDEINDNGWGCAYRSLQLIVSWFRLQGFTNHPVPTHEEIQKCLVDIGDKPRTFIGSRQWIGSTEISYCLESMLGVTSRIIAINSGEELSERGSELIYHFKTQGTPIMIGGGVLAHTIIGVHFNNQTGNIKLLIVDPHYVGSEDLKTIQDNGWVGWKPISFWQKNTFYNLCLPLKPNCV
ncbi:unnamed protein product [Bemisia tabaci]|uniref:Probable Ufm1-specific protease 2 n=1 Tax=Bemisia tabaci TaxID=7038 RepID=A0A9P0AA22_BEMTA|nr:unnamed protein product [Bemisia tabaci]